MNCIENDCAVRVVCVNSLFITVLWSVNTSFPHSGRLHCFYYINNVYTLLTLYITWHARCKHVITKKAPNPSIHVKRTDPSRWIHVTVCWKFLLICKIMTMANDDSTIQFQTNLIPLSVYWTKIFHLCHFTRFFFFLQKFSSQPTVSI